MSVSPTRAEQLREPDSSPRGSPHPRSCCAKPGPLGLGAGGQGAQGAGQPELRRLMFPAVLLANLGTISAIRYFRRQVSRGRRSPPGSRSPSPSS